MFSQVNHVLVRSGKCCSTAAVITLQPDPALMVSFILLSLNLCSFLCHHPTFLLDHCTVSLTLLYLSERLSEHGFVLKHSPLHRCELAPQSSNVFYVRNFRTSAVRSMFETFVNHIQSVPC